MTTTAVMRTATPPQAWVLASLSLSMLMPSLDTSIANVGLPAMARAFSVSFPAVQWVVLAYLLAITSLIVGAGRLGDAFGRKRLLLSGIGLFTTASLLCGLAPSLEVLIVARALQGAGAAVMMALTIAMAGESVPKEKTGSVMGLLGTMSAAGTMLGPSLGGILIAGFGWPLIFLVNVPLGVINIWLAQRSLPADGPSHEARPGGDMPGTLLLAGALAAYALAAVKGSGLMFAVAAAGAVVFVSVESRLKSPLVRPAMFAEPVLGTGLVMMALVATVMMATLVIGPFYLARGLGLPPAMVGLVMSAGPLMSALAGVPSGRIVDRIGSGKSLMVGLCCIIAGTAALSLMPVRFGIAGYVGPILIVTAGYALFQAANTTRIMTGVAVGQKGVVSGLLSLSRNLGLITGASAMGAVFAHASGTAKLATASAEAVADGMHVSFGVAAGLGGIALVVASLLRGRRA